MFRDLVEGTHQTYQKEMRYLHKDGRAIWTQLNVSVVRDAAGAAMHFVGQVQDITERKQAEQTLREREERLRVVVDTALDAVISMDAAGLVTEWNAQAESIFGWTRQEAVGPALGELIVPRSTARLTSAGCSATRPAARARSSTSAWRSKRAGRAVRSFPWSSQSRRARREHDALQRIPSRS